MITLKFNQFIAEASKTEAIYNDYPSAAKANAKKALDWRDEHGREEVDGGTEVGWARANQLAKGEKLSRDVVSRMAQFNRHRKNSKVSAEFKDTPWKDRGYIAWLIWGGDEGVDWAMKKMEEIKAEETSEKLNVKNSTKLFEQFVLEGYILGELETQFNIELDLYDNGDYLELTRIVVPKSEQGKGVGSDVMQRIVDYADHVGKKIYLTPSKDFGASSVSRLESFYKGFNFVKKPKDDFSNRNTMVRFPNN